MFGRFGRATNAVAMIEFAIVLPLLLTILLGAAELARFQRFQRHLQETTQNIANTIAGLPANATSSDLHRAWDSAMVTFPELLQDANSKNMNWWDDLGSQIDSVVVTPTVPGCTSACSYQANVVFYFNWWEVTHGLIAQAGLGRTCGTLAPGGPVPTATTLPASLFKPGALIVVDAIFNYTPLFGTSFFPSILIQTHAIATPRYISPYMTATAVPNDTIECPGY